jgi:hypothetical protein
MAGDLPIGTQLPGISIKQISSNEFKTIRRSGTRTATDRVQVSALASTYVQQKQIIDLIRVAIQSVRGAVNGILVDSIAYDSDGPDLQYENPVTYQQSIDYLVRFYR